MVSEELIQQRSEFYDSYVSGNNSVNNSALVSPLSSPGLSPSIGQPLLPRASLMHAVRSCGLCPTEKELEAAEVDALEPHTKFVTKDQFLEICEQLKSLSTDVQHQEVLDAFKAVILNEDGKSSGSSKGLLLPPSTDELCKSLSGSSSSEKKKEKQERFVFTHKEMRVILPELNDEQFKQAMQWLDPQNTNQIDVRRVSELLSSGVEKRPIVNGATNKNRLSGSSNKNSPGSPIQATFAEQHKAKASSPQSPPATKEASPVIAPKKGEEKKASGGCCVIQ